MGCYLLCSRCVSRACKGSVGVCAYAGVVLDTHRTILESSMPATHGGACFGSGRCLTLKAAGHCVKVSLAAAALFILLVLATAKGVSMGIGTMSVKH